MGLEDMVFNALEERFHYKEKLAAFQGIFKRMSPALNKITPAHYTRLLDSWNLAMGLPLTQADVATVVKGGQEFAAECKKDFGNLL